MKTVLGVTGLVLALQLHGGVRYLGVFINDEDWCLRPWCQERFGKERGICAEAYEEIFADMKARGLNLLWPAMHPDGYEFVSRRENMDAAKRAGITIGTSHCEPMLRNNCYWKKEQGVWDYTANKQGIDAYWKWSVDNYGDQDCLWTIGIRGIHDAGMKGPKDPKARIRILEDVFAAQTAMLGPERPKVFCPYKEVLPLYDAGLKVPEDAALLWVDDNFGYIRRLGGPKAEGRRQGVYWHVSYYGGPHSYTHVCTTPPAFMWYQLVARCWENGVRDIWMLNVGDYWPADMAIYALGQIGKSPEAWDEKSHARLLRGYVESVLRGESAAAVDATVRVLDEYYRLGWIRKPELMCAQWARALPAEERRRLDGEYANLAAMLDKALASMTPEGRGRFMAINGYSVRFFALAGRYFMAWGDAGEDADLKSRLKDEVLAGIKALEDEVSSVEDGRWKGFWWDTSDERRKECRYIKNGRNNWASQMQWPWNEPDDMRPKYICTVWQADPWIASARMQDASAFKDAHAGDGASWKKVDGLGASYSAMALLPVKPGAGKGAALEYELEAKEGEEALVLQFLPDFRLFPGGKLRVAVSVNGAEPFEVEVPGSNGREDEKGETRRYAVQDGFVRAARKGVLKAGKNSVKVLALDAGVVLDKVGAR